MRTDSACLPYQCLGNRYASDLTDAEFALIEPMLPRAKRGGRCRVTGLCEVLNALLYLLRTGCPSARCWPRLLRMQPVVFPPRSTVYDYFPRFGQLGDWKHLWMTLLMAAREQVGKEVSPSAAIIDSQCVNTTESGGTRGYYAGKKILGRPTRSACRSSWSFMPPTSRIAMVWPRSAAASTAGFPWLTLVFADGGYEGNQAAAAAAQERLKLEIVKRPRDADGFHLLPRRWVIERTFVWLGRNRRLAKDVETLIETSTVMAAVAIVQLLVRRLATV